MQYGSIMTTTQRTGIRDILLSVGIIMGFVFLVTVAIFFIRERWLVHTCSCTYSIPFILVALSSLGIFVGVLIYYFLEGRIQKTMHSLEHNAHAALRIVDNDERKIIEALIRHDGALLQSRLDKETGLTRLQAWRTLERLEKKNVIIKERTGKTNNVRLSKELLDAFGKGGEQHA